MVVPSSTFPQRCDVPATWSRELTSWVLPASPCPITARFLMFSVANDFIAARSPYSDRIPNFGFQIPDKSGIWAIRLLVNLKFILRSEKGQEKAFGAAQGKNHYRIFGSWFIMCLSNGSTPHSKSL